MSRQYFDEDYVNKHVQHNSNDIYHPFSWDEEGEKKVTGKEISDHREEIQAIAYGLMNSEWSEPRDIITGARLYTKLGKGGKVIPKLISKLEKWHKSGYTIDSRDLVYVKMLIKKSERERQRHAGGLEIATGRELAFLGSVFAGIALGLTSITPTGNAIGNLTGTSQGLIGLILFVFGLAGLFFSGKK